jgi:hypothetical protein
MHIDTLFSNAGAEATKNSVAISSTRPRPVAGYDQPPAADQVDMSMISRIMARNLRELADSDQVRPEKIAAFQALPRQTARFDDQAIDRIFRAMQGS